MIGIDLGTTHVRVFIKGRGIVLREPAVIAVGKGGKDIKAVGTDAYNMIGRTPGSIQAVRPMADGVIADYSLTEKMLRAFVGKVLRGPSRFLRPNIMVCVPSGITEVEKRAVLQAVNELNAKKSFIIEEPIAAAIGAGINIADPVGSMVVDIGGGTTDVAIISLGGIVVSDSVKVAGNILDDDIVRYVRRKENLLIGDRTAEEVKRTIGSAMLLPGEENISKEISGRDLINGMPRSITLTTEDVISALSSSLSKMADSVRKVLEKGPPELISDVVERGIVLTGGGAMLRNLDIYLQKLTHIPVMVAENPQDCVVIGTGKALDSADVLESANANRQLQYY